MHHSGQGAISQLGLVQLRKQAEGTQRLIEPRAACWVCVKVEKVSASGADTHPGRIQCCIWGWRSSSPVGESHIYCRNTEGGVERVQSSSERVGDPVSAVSSYLHTSLTLTEALKHPAETRRLAGRSRSRSELHLSARETSRSRTSKSRAAERLTDRGARPPVDQREFTSPLIHWAPLLVYSWLG